MPDEVDPEENSTLIFDVRLLVKGLGTKHRKLQKAARKWIAYHSCSADLAITRDCLDDALRWHSTGRSSLNRAKTALFHSAILSYARMFDPSATHHRAELPILGKLADDQRAFHDRLIQLRHEALAHYGKAGVTEPWYEDALFVIADQKNWQPMIASRRSQFDAKFCKDFQNHVHSIEPYVESLVESLKNDFQDNFQSAWEADIDFYSHMQGAQVDARKLGGWNGPILAGSRSGRLQVELPDRLFKQA